MPFADEFRQLPRTTEDESSGGSSAHLPLLLPGYGGRPTAYMVTDASAASAYWATVYREGIGHVVAVGSGGAMSHVPDEGDERQFGDVRVHTTVRRRLTHATTTTFQIRPTDEAEARTLQQYEFTDWPAASYHAVPSTPLRFAEFVQTVRMSSRRAPSDAGVVDTLLVLRSTHDQHAGIHLTVSRLKLNPTYSLT